MKQRLIALLTKLLKPLAEQARRRHAEFSAARGYTIMEREPGDWHVQHLSPDGDSKTVARTFSMRNASMIAYACAHHIGSTDRWWWA